MDTNVASFMLKGHSLGTRYRRHLQGHQLAVSFMTVAELYEWGFTPAGGKHASQSSMLC
jgi:tRNA(fMet)-specific endonuclease VapC